MSTLEIAITRDQKKKPGYSSMKDISKYIESGIIEACVLGLATAEEMQEMEELSILHSKVREAVDVFMNALEQHALTNAVAPDPLIKPMLMATIDFMNRMNNGEAPSFPPDLTETSAIADYAQWLQRPDMVSTPHFTNIYAKLIGHTLGVTTAIVWIKEMAAQEVHNDEYEKFLIVEGTCDITIEKDVHHLASGDFLAIPLYKNHLVTVTSLIPCKVVLQRVAA